MTVLYYFLPLYSNWQTVQGHLLSSKFLKVFNRKRDEAWIIISPVYKQGVLRNRTDSKAMIML